MSTAQSAVVPEYRTIYIVTYTPSPLFPAHWSLWIPSKARPEVGTLIHVTGDSRSGFHHEFKRGYNVSQTRRRPCYMALAQIEERYVTDGPATGIDATAYNYLEQVALSILAPGPSLRNVPSSGRSTRVEIKNCQTWLRDLIRSLIDNNVISSAAQTIIDQTPQH